MTRTRQTCWAIVPVKPPGVGKTRLAEALDDDARKRLVSAMLHRVVMATQACPSVDGCYLVGASDHGLAAYVSLLGDAGAGLNAALAGAMQMLPQPLPDRLIVIAADLPQITPADLMVLANVAPRAIAIAPDRHGTGTNALSLPIAAARTFHFQFGPGSYWAHRAGAERLGYNVETILSDGLEKDIDEPGDLADAAGCLEEML